MVGYCVNGYRLWCPEENKILLGKDVIFNESKFNFDEGDGSFYQDCEVQETSEKMNKEKCQLESRKDQRTPDYQKSNDLSDSSDGEYFESSTRGIK